MEVYLDYNKQEYFDYNNYSENPTTGAVWAGWG
jgi:hypothetical protein